MEMGMAEVRRRVAASRAAPIAALPERLSAVARFDAHLLRESAIWLLRSREHTNYTYDLTPRNLEHLAWWVSTLTGVPVPQVRAVIAEAQSDAELHQHIRRGVEASPRRGLADKKVRLGRRLGWYALVRALRPDHVVETGTDKGHGSVVLAAALLRNGHGRLTTIDIHPDSGYLISDPYAEVAERIVGDSIAALGGVRGVDIFLHDSLHTFEHEAAELAAVGPRLTPNALVLSDNAHATDALMRWAEQSGRQFSFFREQPTGHWYPGSGIGAAWRHRECGS
jgi:Methyltransferase domain